MHTLARVRSQDDRGSMLVVALGILTLLSILALTFVSLMRLEQTASTNYVDGVKARLVAEGGLELSMATLKRTAGTEAYSNPNADWIYAQGNYWLPLEEASAVRRGDPNDTPALNAIRASFAGELGQSYAAGRDQYKIKVIDTQTQFNLNSNYEVLDGLDEGYIRYLNALGVAISKLNPRARSGSGTSVGAGRNPIIHARFPKGSPNAFRGAEAIFRFRDSREGKKFNSKTELLEVLDNEDDYGLLRDYVTDRSWFDPKTVTARAGKLIGDSGNPDTMKVWSDVVDKERRSPINVNLATTEVIAANLAGIAGRAVFLYTGDPAASTGRLQKIDAGTKFEYATQSELRPGGYQPVPVLVYLSPMGYHAGAQPNDPPTIHGSLVLAQALKNRIQTAGPFKSFAEWEGWVDQNVTDGMIENTRDPDTGTYEFPRPDDARVFQLNHNLLTANPSESDVKRHPAFKPWFYDAVRSMIKANMNPNPRLSSWNPDAAVYLPVDKGALLYPQDPQNPASTKARHQTNEWCFSSKGIFEIISLGEILGPVKEPDPTKPDDKLLYAQSKIRGVLQLYETVSHTSQRDFERNGERYDFDPANPNAQRVAVTSYPVARTYWDPRALNLAGQQLTDALKSGGGDLQLHAEELDGWLQVATRHKTAAVDTRVMDMGNPTFELLFQDRRVCDPAVGDALHRDSLVADISGAVPHNPAPGRPVQGRPANGWAWPFGSAVEGVGATGAGGVSPSTRSSTEQEAWRWDVLTPDGYLASETRRTYLWYRASDRNSAALAAQPDGRLRGSSFTDLTQGGNVAPTPRGAVELWYKPEFDWSLPNAGGGGVRVPDGRYCGILATSHVVPNDTGFKSPDTARRTGSWTRGTQMFVTRTTEGDLRITRLFYEVVGPSGDLQEEPLVEDPAATGGGGGLIKFSEYFARAKGNLAYVWPPKELYSVAGTVFERIRWGRTDQWVPFQQLQAWRAHEWHHMAIYWDDYADQENVKVWLDGLPVTTIVKRQWPAGTNDRYEPYFPDPRGAPPAYPPLSYSQFTTVSGQPPPVTLLDGKMPSFVRLNAKTGPAPDAGAADQAQREETLWPKDQIVIGGVRREQAAVGGLFKHEQNALLPSNGTVDDVRFYTGVQVPTQNQPAERYEELGQWVNEFDLSAYFPTNVDQITLGQLSFNAYLPTYYAAERFPNGTGSVVVTAQIVDSAGVPKQTFPNWAASFDAIGSDKVYFPLVTDTGAPVTVIKGDRLQYTVEITAGRNQAGYNVVTPIVDDVSIVYFLPNSRVLLQERVNQ